MEETKQGLLLGGFLLFICVIFFKYYNQGFKVQMFLLKFVSISTKTQINPRTISAHISTMKTISMATPPSPHRLIHMLV